MSRRLRSPTGGSPVASSPGAVTPPPTQASPSDQFTDTISARTATPPSVASPSDASSEDRSRLTAIAKYDSLIPKALACSPPILAAASSYFGESASGGKGACTSRTTANSLEAAAAMSLGAVAGANGIALFRVTKPHAPLLVLSLSSSSSASPSPHSNFSAASPSPSSRRTDDWVSALCFQHTSFDRGGLSSFSSPSSFYLAAARGSGILVWDVSGHSLSPLWGRLTVSHGDGLLYHQTSGYSDAVTSLAWHRSSQDGPGCLAATTATSAFLWDLRESPRSAASKPSLRFGRSSAARRGVGSTATRGNSLAIAPNLQIACSHRHDSDPQCAILDQSGKVRLYDLRMVGNPASAAHANEPILSFEAFRHAGVALSYFPTSVSQTTDASGSTWLAWGMDAPRSDAVVRVWSSGEDSSATDGLPHPHSGEDPIFLDSSSVDGSAIATGPLHASSSTSVVWRILAQCSPRNLACARVCPSPLEDAFVTVSFEHTGSTSGGGDSLQSSTANWRADLWKLAADTSDDGDCHQPKSTAGLERVLSFRGGPNADRQRVPPQHSHGGSQGDFRYGSLCAAELGVTAASRFAEASRARRSEGGASLDDPHLLLCSLTDSGCVVAHAFPEVDWGESLAGRGRDGEMLTTAPGSALPTQLRVFPRDKDSPIPDAAGGWAHKSRDTASTTVDAPAIAKIDSRDAKGGSGVAALAHEPSGPPQLPFDMDFSPFSRNVDAVPIGGVMGLMPGSSILPAPTDVAAGSELSPEDARDAAQLMERIDTSRIPCPRLCGASFGPGVGGLPVFHNGDVRKMWKWWDKSNSTRPTAVSSQSVSIEALVVDGDDSYPHQKRDFPRTLMDLTVMTSSAKEAQWGSQDDSDVSSSGLPDAGPSFFEEGSDASSDSDDNDSVDPTEKGLYDSYFGSSRPSVVDGSPVASREASDSQFQEKQSTDQFGPVSDVLSPYVTVSCLHEKLALNGQCVKLAMDWKLGSVAILSKELDAPDTTTLSHYKQEPNLTRKRTDLPKYRFLVPASQQSYRIPKVSSDPMLQKLLTPPKSMPSEESEEERGVHGGDYGVRPNMQESMVFLRKLLTHHHEPNLFSPPDGPMLPNSRSDPAVSKAVAMSPSTPFSNAISSSQKAPDSGTQTPIGLCTLRAIDSLSRDALEELLEMEENCLHNAQVCEALGESGKQATWEILAKAVGSRHRDFGSTFDSPGAVGRGALGTKLVERFLRFYEVQGDVQMLSTMVCVLRRRSADRSNSKSWSILPTDQTRKFDLYLSRYADLLFSWGLLTTRAELNKHLSSATGAAAAEVTGESPREESSNLSHAFTCPRCSKETMPGQNFCRYCQDFAFRCTVCDHAVRGLFTSCEACGHGGHTEHLQQWFSNHEQCPTGCGCLCTLGTGGGGGSAPARPEATIVASVVQPSVTLDGGDVPDSFRTAAHRLVEV